MKNFVSKIVSQILVVFVFLISVSLVSAHAVVKPNTAGVGSYVDFTLGVPSEKDSATTSVKLFIPEGINSVSPIVKSGWSVKVEDSSKTGEPDDDGNVSPIPEAIVWTGGSVPAHQKDFFMFSTQVPAEETELIWKVEQTYSDGSVVSWNLAPNEQPKDEKGNPDFSKLGPYSKTKVINDLRGSADPVMSKVVETSEDGGNLPLILSAVAVIVSGFALGMTFRKK